MKGDKTPQSNTLGFQNRANSTYREGKVSTTVQHSEWGLHLHDITELTAMGKHLEGLKPLQALQNRNTKHGLWMEQCSVSEKPTLGSIHYRHHQSNLEMKAPLSYLSLHTGATHLGGWSYTTHIGVLPETNTSLHSRVSPALRIKKTKGLVHHYTDLKALKTINKSNSTHCRRKQNGNLGRPWEQTQGA